MQSNFRKSIVDANLNLKSMRNSDGPIIDSNEADLDKKRVKPMIIDIEQ
jgi:hypothetical protein